jgi:hypothetical protein
MLRKNKYTIPGLKTAIQSKIEDISTETLIKVLNNFLLRLHRGHDLRGQHMGKCFSVTNISQVLYNDQ